MDEVFVSDFQASFNVQQNVLRIKSFLDRLTYKDNWTFSIISHAGWNKGLQIRLNVPDSTVPKGSGMTVQLLIDHQFQIPWFEMGELETCRWLLDCILLVHRHEACENFKIDGEAIFYPEHGENADPYKIVGRENGEVEAN